MQFDYKVKAEELATAKQEVANTKEEYEKACKAFLECRCYSYYQMVLMTSKRLLEASDTHAFLNKVEFDTY